MHFLTVAMHHQRFQAWFNEREGGLENVTIDMRVDGTNQIG